MPQCVLQLGDFLHPFTVGLGAVCKFMVLFHRRIAGRFQIRILQQTMPLQVIQRLCHLFQVEHTGPPLIARGTGLLHLRLNVDQQIRRCPLPLRSDDPLAGDALQDSGLGVVLPQRGTADKLFSAGGF